MKSLNRRQLRLIIESILSERDIDDELESMAGGMSGKLQRRGGRSRGSKMDKRAAAMDKDAAVGGKEKPLPKNEKEAKEKAQEFYDALVKAKKDHTGQDFIRKNSALRHLYQCTGSVGDPTVKVKMSDGTKKDFMIRKSGMKSRR